MEHAYSDHRVERPAFEPLPSLDVADNDLRARANAVATDSRRLRAQFDGDEVATGPHEALRELTRACTELESAHAAAEPGGRDEERRAARGP